MDRSRRRARHAVAPPVRPRCQPAGGARLWYRSDRSDRGLGGGPDGRQDRERRGHLAGSVDRTATTDQDGQFAFGDLPDGEYRLRVGPDGFAPTEKRVRLSSGATVSVAFKLVGLVTERVVVTASKTGEHEVQSTPLAVSVLSGEELRRRESRTVVRLAVRLATKQP